MTQEEYYRFKNIIINNSLNEQKYGCNNVYYHLSTNKFEKFKKQTESRVFNDFKIESGLPIFLSRTEEFYLEPYQEFNIHNSKWDNGYMYLVKFIEPLNIYNARNHGDSTVDIYVKKFLIEMSKRDKDYAKYLSRLWKAFKLGNYWSFIELDNPWESDYKNFNPNPILYSVIAKYYDGFDASTWDNNGLLGVFYPEKLKIIKIISVKDFRKFIDKNINNSGNNNRKDITFKDMELSADLTVK